MATKSKSKHAAPAQADPVVRRPTHRLYSVVGDGPGALWTSVGAAWPNKDGKGFSLSCDAISLKGRIVLRLIEPKPRAAGGQP
ncbi:MAG: hypothetical protein JO126_04165 [Alphaproteobacteria bacterium]|nr:hypothetical protein [Alphaproteobacteria bacterium]